MIIRLGFSTMKQLLGITELLPRFATPRFVEAFAEFPRTPTDKVRKVELRQRGVRATTWDSNAER